MTGWRSGRTSSSPGGWDSRVMATSTLVLCGRVGSGGRGVVSAVALDPVQSAVRGRDQVRPGPTVCREGGYADRGTDRDGAALLADEGVVPERHKDPFRGGACIVGIRLGQDDREF